MQPGSLPVTASEIAFANEAVIPNGFTAGFAPKSNQKKYITDFAIHPGESNGVETVLYGVGDQVGGKWYLYRYRLIKPQEEVTPTSGHLAYVSYREITGLAGARGYMASAAFRRDGKLFVYSSNGKVFEIDPVTAQATHQLDAVQASNADGASCMTSIHAENDGDGAAPFVTVSNGADTTTEAGKSVFKNDTAYLQPLQLSGVEQNATLTVDSWAHVAGDSAPAPGAITLNADGTVTVKQATKPGTYTYQYEICAWPGITPAGSACKTAQAVIHVTEVPIVAEDDNFRVVGAGGPPLATSIAANDKVAGAQAMLTGPTANAQVKAGSWQKVSGMGNLTLDETTGQVTVPAGTPHGDYVYSYELCTKTGVLPEKCDPAQVKLTVVAIAAANNAFGTVNAGATTASVYGDDTVDGTAITIGTDAQPQPNSWSLVSGPAGGSLNFDPATGQVSVPANAPAGDYKYSYGICLLDPNGHVCDTAEVTLTVQPMVDAVDNASGDVAEGARTVTIFGNDQVKGVAAVLGGANPTAALKPGSWIKLPGSPAGNLTLNADGTVTVPVGTPAGNYQYRYEICALPGNTPCDTATVTLTVMRSGAGGITAVPANAPWALLLATLGIVGMARRVSRQRG